MFVNTRLQPDDSEPRVQMIRKRANSACKTVCTELSIPKWNLMEPWGVSGISIKGSHVFIL